MGLAAAPFRDTVISGTYLLSPGLWHQQETRQMLINKWKDFVLKQIPWAVLIRDLTRGNHRDVIKDPEELFGAFL